MWRVCPQPLALGEGVCVLTLSPAPRSMMRNMDIRPLFSPSFWFDMTPTALSPGFERAFFIFFAIFVVAGAALRIAARREKRDKYDRLLLHRAASSAFIYGITGFLIYFFTYEEVSFFGSRFWFLLWFILLVITVVRFVRFMKREVPQLRHRDQSRVDSNKYLPRRG